MLSDAFEHALLKTYDVPTESATESDERVIFCTDGESMTTSKVVNAVQVATDTGLDGTHELALLGQTKAVDNPVVPQ